MGDSFADLWHSSAPGKPPEPPRKLGASHAPSSSGPNRPKYDAFSMLAASSSSSSSPRSLTPSSTAAASVQRPNSGAMATTSGDAFGDLLGSFGGGSSNSKLTMAEKAAKAKAQVIRQPVPPSQSTKAWAGLDSLANTASFSSSQPTNSKFSRTDDDWLFDSSTSSAQVEPSPPEPSIDDWGLEDFISGPKPSVEATTPAPSSRGKSLLDLDDFRSSSERDHGLNSSAQNLPPSRSDTPGDFDFGDRENALLDEDSGSDDDVLGDLGRSAHERPAERPLPPVCGVSLTGQTSTDLLTTLFPGCRTHTENALSPTPSSWTDRRNGILPRPSSGGSRFHRVRS
jgi:hypothetical protein